MSEEVGTAEHTSGEFLGEMEGLKIRGVLDGPVLEVHGDEGMAAVEITSESFVDGLTEAAAQVQTILDRQSVENGGDEA